MCDGARAVEFKEPGQLRLQTFRSPTDLSLDVGPCVGPPSLCVDLVLIHQNCVLIHRKSVLIHKHLVLTHQTHVLIHQHHVFIRQHPVLINPTCVLILC